MANRLRHVGVDIDDLISAGTVGLLKAADGHDATRGKFTTFAWWKIRSELSAVIAAQRRANRTKLMSAVDLDRMPW
jgi:DNA-directed RNA polymerase sigma subunit (sigma70/sigma32)